MFDKLAQLLDSKFTAFSAQVSTRFDHVSTQFDRMQKEMEFVGGQVEELSGKVETLEVAAELPHREYDDDAGEDVNGEEGMNVGGTVPQATGFGKSARPERQCRVNARNAPYSG